MVKIGTQSWGSDSELQSWPDARVRSLSESWTVSMTSFSRICSRPYPYSNKISKIDTIVPKISEKNLKFQQEEPWLSRNDIESYLNKLFRSNWGQKRSFRRLFSEKWSNKLYFEMIEVNLSLVSGSINTSSKSLIFFQIFFMVRKLWRHE